MCHQPPCTACLTPPPFGKWGRAHCFPRGSLHHHPPCTGPSLLGGAGRHLGGAVAALLLEPTRPWRAGARGRERRRRPRTDMGMGRTPSALGRLWRAEARRGRRPAGAGLVAGGSSGGPHLGHLAPGALQQLHLSPSGWPRWHSAGGLTEDTTSLNAPIGFFGVWFWLPLWPG